MSTDIETRLRAAFRASADVITDEAPAPLRAPANRRQQIWWPLLAAAAVVLAVAALALVVRGGTKHRTPPVHSAPAPVLHRQSCTVPLPGAWASAVRSGTVRGLRALAVTDSGAVLAARLDRPDIVLVNRNHHERVLYAAPRTTREGDVRVGPASLDGDWAAVGLITGGGQGGLDGIVAINVKTGAVRTARSLLLGTLPIVESPALLGGVVYWSEGLSVGPDHVYAYDVRTGHRRTLDTSGQLDILGPEILGGGIYWTKADRTVVYRAGNLPPRFTVQTGKSYGGLVTDGDRQAWVQQVGQRFVVKMRIGAGAPVTMEGPVSDPPEITGIAGPYVLVGTSVLDSRTGAAAQLTSAARGPFVDIASNGPTIAVSFTPANIAQAGSTLSSFDTTTLPGPRC